MRDRFDKMAKEICGYIRDDDSDYSGDVRTIACQRDQIEALLNQVPEIKDAILAR